MSASFEQLQKRYSELQSQLKTYNDEYINYSVLSAELLQKSATSEEALLASAGNKMGGSNENQGRGNQKGMYVAVLQELDINNLDLILNMPLLSANKEGMTLQRANDLKNRLINLIEPLAEQIETIGKKQTKADNPNYKSKKENIEANLQSLEVELRECQSLAQKTNLLKNINYICNKIKLAKKVGESLNDKDKYFINELQKLSTLVKDHQKHNNIRVGVHSDDTKRKESREKMKLLETQIKTTVESLNKIGLLNTLEHNLPRSMSKRSISIRGFNRTVSQQNIKNTPRNEKTPNTENTNSNEGASLSTVSQSSSFDSNASPSSLSNSAVSLFGKTPPSPSNTPSPVKSLLKQNDAPDEAALSLRQKK